ncbi:tol-pal system protein YbgF [Sinisalibacter lacisalsi]|uniref:Cell division coordinator CpoB n=1 Tax=Sinisalibacter lacisalsi TaxID=1526570 RepID=A0ABQ1QUI0_9RHOB|nr:tol-pal system protein YbgF [Sinisalibacter lacisalsi]GGD45636.1 tol-pal system protein YbgF [Sinisalibacter lacisalsi]
MAVWARMIAATLALLLLAMPLKAQDRAQTLADIRQELTVLYVEIQRLKGELNTTGGASAASGGGSMLDRVNAIEAQVTRLTAKSEELEFRINQVVSDGTNRVGDLEFRLCELEADCDISKLGETPALGGGSLPEVTGPAASAIAATPDPAAGTGTGQLAVAERDDFDAAQAALEAGNATEAAELFGRFVEAYPGGPLTGEAHYLRGEALTDLGMVAEAARAYLASYSGSPQGPKAADALFKLGAALGELGQINEACVTLGEVANRFPGAAAVAEAQAARASLGCD